MPIMPSTSGYFPCLQWAYIAYANLSSAFLFWV